MEDLRAEETTSLPKIHSDLVWTQEVDEDGAPLFRIVNPNGGPLVEFNQLQFDMLQSLDGKTPTSEVTKRVEKQHNTEISVEATEEFLTDVQSLGLLELSYAPAEDRYGWRRHFRCRVALLKLQLLRLTQLGSSDSDACLSQLVQALQRGDAVSGLSFLERARKKESTDVRLLRIHKIVENIFFEANTPINPLFFRILRFNPERLLDRIGIFLSPFFSRATLFFLFLFGLGALLLGTQIKFQYLDGRNHLDAPAAALAYVLFSLTLGVHELAHGAVCRHFKGRVTEMGASLMYGVFIVFYVNTTSAYILLNRVQRIWTILAGSIINCTMISLSIWLLFFVPLSDLWRQALEIFAFGGLLATAVNLIPLFKGDGYYLLVEATGVRNLRERAFALLAEKIRDGFSRLLFRRSKVEKSIVQSPTNNATAGLLLYGAISAGFVPFLVYFGAIPVYEYCKFAWGSAGVVAFWSVVLTAWTLPALQWLRRELPVLLNRSEAN